MKLSYWQMSGVNSVSRSKQFNRAYGWSKSKLLSGEINQYNHPISHLLVRLPTDPKKHSFVYNKEDQIYP